MKVHQAYKMKTIHKYQQQSEENKDQVGSW